MQDCDLPSREHVVRWWKLGRATRVAEVELASIRRGESLIYKQYHFKGWHEALATLFRPNQATRAWNNGAALLLRELPTPRPLALIHRTKFGLPVTSFLVTERVPGQGLRHYVEDRRVEADPREARRIVLGVLEQAASLLRRLHERSVTHRDLKASNVLASPTADPARPQLWLIDLDGVQTWRKAPESLRVQNLARLHVSFCRCHWLTTTDKLRFMRLYLGRAFNDRATWKRLWRAIERCTRDKIRRNTRRGRQIL
jgi:serine/threonine protein kinase